MSWSLSTDVHPGSDIRDAIDHVEPQSHVSEAQLAQIRLAKEQAKAIINTTLLGDANIFTDEVNYFKVRIAGHAGETPEPGDLINVTVERSAPPG